MIYGAEAALQIEALRRHYAALERPEAIRNLIAALEQAERRIELAPEAGLPAPRPYPDLAKAGRLWIKAGRYWIAYLAEKPPAILAVFYDMADIPGRL